MSGIVPAYEVHGRSAWSELARGKIVELAQHTRDVLVVGRLGTGKRHLARALHARSLRAARPFIPVSCALLRGALFESQLFGHLPGAFASLSSSALGCFGSAEGGVVYLADIDQLDRASQVQLREVVKRRTLLPRGGREAIAFDVRLIAGTTVDLEALVERHEFDARLYRHFAAQTMHAADLRDRRDDLDELAAQFLDDAAHQHGAPQSRLSSSARAWMRTYPWPGNVAQLRRVILGAAATRRPLIDCELLRRLVTGGASGRASAN